MKDLKEEASKAEQGVEKAPVIGGFTPKPTSEQLRKFPCTVTTGMPKIAQGNLAFPSLKHASLQTLTSTTVLESKQTVNVLWMFL